MNDLKFTTAQHYVQSIDPFLQLARTAGLKFSSEDALSPPERLFAVSIVDQCSQLLEEQGMVEVAMMIKQHFGIL